MARPAILQLLQRGKALCGKIFPNFVETWNYTVNRCDNLAGDRDGDPQNGWIEVDNTDPEHPIIRYVPKDDDGSAEAATAVGNVADEADDGTSAFGEIPISGRIKFTSSLGNVRIRARKPSATETDIDGVIEIDVYYA